MSYKFDPENPLFRALFDEEEAEFTLYASLNPPEDLSKWEIYHPICRAEWVRQGIKPSSNS